MVKFAHRNFKLYRMRNSFIFGCLLCVVPGSASTVQEGAYGPAELIDTVKSKGIVTEISFMTPDIVNIRRYMVGKQVGKHNLVVTLPKQDVEVEISQTGSSFITLESETVGVRYYKATGGVVFVDKNGDIILREKLGATELTERKDGTFDSYRVKQTFLPNSMERFYGLGQLQNGNLSHRNQTYSYMIEGNTSVWIPYIHSTKGYSLFWDNASPTTYSDGTDGMSFESAVGYGVDYYFMKGSETDGNEAIRQMRMLTGQVPMIPLWAYGYFQSKERYASADETMGVAAQYRRLKVPLDCVVQDWQYWGGNNLWNAMEFSNPEFSNYQEMIDSVHRMDAHLLISTWANFGPDTKPYRHFKEQGQLIRQGDDIMTDTYPSNEGVAVYDTYSASARDAYWKFMYDGLISKGIDGYWLDSSEPDHYQGGDDMEETFDFVTGMGCTWRSARNAYPLVHVGGVYDHHRAEPALADKRCVILTRSAYAGQQRYGASTWSADITASWTTFQNQIPAALNLTASGNPNWNSDIGAFFNGDLGGPGNEEYNELYARWFQFATFCPMMRSHGAGTDKAIYVWGKRGTEYFDNVERYINLRYALLPYIYSTAWGVHRMGQSFMKALGIEYPEDTRALDVKDQYLFGNSLLVAPVMSYEARSREVYLPEGTHWIDFWNGTAVEGGQTVESEAALDVMPLFVKSGSILPWARPVQHADMASWDTLQIRIYPGADGSFTLYEDEGDNYNYEQGAYSTIRFDWDDAGRRLTVGARSGSFSGMMENRVFDVVLVDGNIGCADSLSAQANCRIMYNGTEQTVTIDENQRIEVGYETGLDNEMEDVVFDMAEFNPAIKGGGTLDGRIFCPDNRGFGGWWMETGMNLSGYRYLVAEIGGKVPETVSLRAYTQNNYSSIPVICRGNGESSKIYIDLTEVDNLYGVGIWSLVARRIEIEKVYLTNDLPDDATSDASVPYTFTAEEWVTGDANRVAQSDLCYDREANTVTVQANGVNNVCLQLSPDKSDVYYVEQGRPLMCVKASHVSELPEDSKMWYTAGMFTGEMAATKTFTAADGDQVIVWDLSSLLPDQSRLPLCFSELFIFCMGLTSTTGTSVISEIGFYTEEELPNIGTTIRDVETDAETDDAVYNLQGIRMPENVQLPAGIYIRNNKKVMIK